MTQGEAGDDAWMQEAIIEFLQSPCYINPLMTFVDEKCVVFQDEEENALEYTQLHQEFKDVVDGLLTTFLEDLGVSLEQFAQTVSTSGDKLSRTVVGCLLAADDFLQFKSLMVHRNLHLQRQVLDMLEARAKLKAEEAQAAAAAAAAAAGQAEAEQREMEAEAARLDAETAAIEAAEASASLGVANGGDVVFAGARGQGGEALAAMVGEQEPQYVNEEAEAAVAVEAAGPDEDEELRQAIEQSKETYKDEDKRTHDWKAQAASFGDSEEAAIAAAIAESLRLQNELDFKEDEMLKQALALSLDESQPAPAPSAPALDANGAGSSSAPSAPPAEDDTAATANAPVAAPEPKLEAPKLPPVARGPSGHLQPPPAELAGQAALARQQAADAAAEREAARCAAEAEASSGPPAPAGATSSRALKLPVPPAFTRSTSSVTNRGAGYVSAAAASGGGGASGDARQAAMEAARAQKAALEARRQELEKKKAAAGLSGEAGKNIASLASGRAKLLELQRAERERELEQYIAAKEQKGSAARGAAGGKKAAPEREAERDRIFGDLASKIRGDMIARMASNGAEAAAES
ncbi:unnamed protein product [Pedinophyceae sp. YPF-701]|nr:unnamed protein product [Pedinophyceae sp. YPF-701]